MKQISSTDHAEAAATNSEKTLWHLVPLQDYKPPAEPPGETVRSTLRALWERLYARTHETDETDNEPDATQLGAVPEGLLERIAPAPGWEGACVAALDQVLDEWLQTDDADAGLQMLVAAPYSGLSEMVINWSRTHDYAIIKPPTHKQIFENSEEWMTQWKQNEADRLVLPWLERCYLRHHNGLDLARRLLDWLWETERPCVLVTDSWAWRYLNCIHPLEALPCHPLTLGAFDANALNSWFYRLAKYQGHDHFIFRRQDNGKPVLVQADHEKTDAEQQDAGSSDQVSSFLRHLAARSRGIPGIAWAIWRHSLRMNRKEDVTKTDEKGTKEEEAKEIQGTGISVWVTPWDELELPEIPTTINGDHTFILHTLLLHNGLTEAILPQILPISPERTLRALRYLQTHQLVAIGENGWQVAPTAYPAVRVHLRSEGYLIDEF